MWNDSERLPSRIRMSLSCSDSALSAVRCSQDATRVRRDRAQLGPTRGHDRL